MEANSSLALKHRPILSRTQRATSSPPPPRPPSSSNRRYPLLHGDARANSGLPMSHPALARTTTFVAASARVTTLAAAGHQFRQNRTRRFSSNPDMATKEPTEKDEARKEEEDKEKREADPPPPRRPPPPPPEQPEPGDCCGSGCVRCVWDVYYEELEDYNKLYGSDPSPEAS